MPFHSTISGVLEHLITPHVEDQSKTYICCRWFPSTSESELRRFLRMSSYYCRFVPNFWKIASPLQSLTHKDVCVDRRVCSFISDAQEVDLCSPSFVSFVRETICTWDWRRYWRTWCCIISVIRRWSPASSSLRQSFFDVSWDKLLNHRAGAPCGCLGNHFVPYLYGRDVTVLTDRTAVKAILQTSNPSGKHARWWTKVYASGVRNVKIQYHLNSSADAPAVHILPSRRIS